MYRTVSTSFWTDAKVVDDFTPEDRYFYLYLFTNPHTNLCGCYEISIRQMVNETGYSRESIENLLKRFEDFHKVIKYSKETKEVLILNWSKHNWTKSEKYIKGLEAGVKKVKNDEFKSFLINKIYGIDTVSNGIYRASYGMDITNTNTNTNSNSNSNTLSDRFEKLWGIYPRKQGKRAAFESYKRAVKDGATDEEIEAGIMAYKDYIDKSGIEQRYVKQGATFFSQRAWTDDFTPMRTKEKYEQSVDDVDQWGARYEQQNYG